MPHFRSRRGSAWDVLEGAFARLLKKLHELDDSLISGAADRTCRELVKSLFALLPKRRLRSGEKESRACNVYLVSSLFLHRCYRYLRKFDSEALHFVTGPRLGGTRVLDTMLIFELSHRSWVRAVGDIRATHDVLRAMDDFGHALTAYFHSHPGRGASATYPSFIDLEYQEGLERGGYPTIGAIFSQDGFVRFFSWRREFTIEVYGLRIREEAKNVYRLTGLENVQVPAPSGGTPRG